MAEFLSELVAWLESQQKATGKNGEEEEEETIPQKRQRKEQEAEEVDLELQDLPDEMLEFIMIRSFPDMRGVPLSAVSRKMRDFVKGFVLRHGRNVGLEKILTEERDLHLYLSPNWKNVAEYRPETLYRLREQESALVTWRNDIEAFVRRLKSNDIVSMHSRAATPRHVVLSKVSGQGLLGYRTFDEKKPEGDELDPTFAFQKGNLLELDRRSVHGQWQVPYLRVGPGFGFGSFRHYTRNEVSARFDDPLVEGAAHLYLGIAVHVDVRTDLSDVKNFIERLTTFGPRLTGSRRYFDPAHVLDFLSDAPEGTYRYADYEAKHRVPFGDLDPPFGEVHVEERFFDARNIVVVMTAMELERSSALLLASGRRTVLDHRSFTSEEDEREPFHALLRALTMPPWMYDYSVFVPEIKNTHRPITGTLMIPALLFMLFWRREDDHSMRFKIDEVVKFAATPETRISALVYRPEDARLATRQPANVVFIPRDTKEPRDFMMAPVNEDVFIGDEPKSDEDVVVVS